MYVADPDNLLSLLRVVFFPFFSFLFCLTRTIYLLISPDLPEPNSHICDRCGDDLLVYLPVSLLHPDVN